MDRDHADRLASLELAVSVVGKVRPDNEDRPDPEDCRANKAQAVS